MYHHPSFEGYANATIPGNFFNWQFAPAWTPHHPEGDVKSLPSFKFDDQEVFDIGWHIHAPSEYLIDGRRSRAEIHMVHTSPRMNTKRLSSVSALLLGLQNPPPSSNSAQ